MQMLVNIVGSLCCAAIAYLLSKVIFYAVDGIVLTTTNEHYYLTEGTLGWIFFLSFLPAYMIVRPLFRRCFGRVPFGE